MIGGYFICFQASFVTNSFFCHLRLRSVIWYKQVGYTGHHHFAEGQLEQSLLFKRQDLWKGGKGTTFQPLRTFFR